MTMMMRRALVLAAGFTVTAILAVAGANAVVLLGAGDSVPAGHEREAPRAQAALVLGALVDPDGRPSPMLRDRIRTAAALYHAGKVEKVLASGDHGRVGYDEVNVMRRELLRLGVADRDLFTDHAGFDTWDSVVRARKVFAVDSALVISQGFHLPRAVWLARRAGLEAHGVAADVGGYAGQSRKGAIREIVARTKAAADAITGAEPRFLGDQIPITGDSRASRG
jgi:SanA protein